jgi:XTP/dITP diphosphohydrolase
MGGAEMTRKLRPGGIVLATHNAGKVREINELLGPYGLVPVAAGDLGLPSPPETGTTFEENARIKAEAAALGSGGVALADDSGLEVEALGGAPGVYSADWAEGEGGRDFSRAMARVAAELAALDLADSPARFVCCLTLAWPDGHVEAFLGEVRGRVSFPPRGANGFGYDPIFTPQGCIETFGEMEPARKHRMSHRADAFRRLVAAAIA